MVRDLAGETDPRLRCAEPAAGRRLQVRTRPRHRHRISSCEPDNLVGVVNRHVRQQPGALVAFRRRVGILENGHDLEDAADAYVKFDKRVEGYTKVILSP